MIRILTVIKFGPIPFEALFILWAWIIYTRKRHFEWLDMPV